MPDPAAQPESQETDDALVEAVAYIVAGATLRRMAERREGRPMLPGVDKALPTHNVPEKVMPELPIGKEGILGPSNLPF